MFRPEEFHFLFWPWNLWSCSSDNTEMKIQMLWSTSRKYHCSKKDKHRDPEYYEGISAQILCRSALKWVFFLEFLLSILLRSPKIRLLTFIDAREMAVLVCACVCVSVCSELMKGSFYRDLGEVPGRGVKWGMQLQNLPHFSLLWLLICI